MKILVLASLLLSICPQFVSAKESTGEKVFGGGVISSYAASSIVFTVYFPVIGGAIGGASLLAVGSVASFQLSYNAKVAMKNALNSDAQEFYLTGNVSEALAQSVDLLQAKAPNLSDAEAIDLLVESVNN
ncbi:MAG: hypothetical protein ACXVLQ_03610 [Bacteriovorax sp.]